MEATNPPIDKALIDRLIRQIKEAIPGDPSRELVSAGLVTIEEASKFLGISRSKIYEMMADGLIKFVKLGRSRRIPQNELIRVASEGLVGGA
ncbi:MAG: helix-turn-helix domain-containing protein [Deltaproteobacteria bacterium]|nr:helix-turn-helix domain-containing protein [Deltaproteobacteria bacterium]